MKGWTACLWVGLGGFLGANARYFVGRAAAYWLGITFPWGTFLINVSGSFLLGLVATAVSQKLVPYGDNVRLTIAIGFIGAYTTFSTFEFETNGLLEDGSWALALANIVGGVVLGLLAVKLGVLVVRRWA